MSEMTETQQGSRALPELDGRYVNLALISERQMTCAFSAEDARTGQAVFIKMLRQSKVGDPTAERLFSNEAALLQLIIRQSPSVPLLPIVDTGVCRERPYFVQPLLEGFTLRAALRAHPVLAGHSAIKLIEGCLQFLAALHAAGVAHGDLSPDNIFIETAEALTGKGRLPDQYRVRLLDYNSARRIDGLENQAQRLVFLKLPYAAPELANGHPLSARSDLYSLGVVFYEAIIGERPYAVRTMSEVAALRANSLPPIPLAFDVPGPIEKFIRTLASADPRGRPHSAAAALLALRDFRDLHRWLTQIDAPPLPALYRRTEGRRSDDPSAPYEVLPHSLEAVAGEQPITLASGWVDPSPHAFASAPYEVLPHLLEAVAGEQPITLASALVDSSPHAFAAPPAPDAALRADVPTVPTAFERKPVDSFEADRQETSMIHAVPVPSFEHEVSSVDFSVFAPASISPGTSFILEVWAYLREQREQLLEMASRHGRLIERGSRGPVLAARGTELTLVLRLDGFNLSEPNESFFWLGEISNVPFIVEAPPELRPGVYPGQISILHDGMLLTRLVFDVEVGKATGETARLGVRREQIKSAFASYASVDREEVLMRVQGIMAAGVDVFLDVLSLRAGDTWEEELIKNIREKDVFYLFWSVAASKSHWVEREWRYAHSAKGIDYIQPIPLSDPREAPPPKELAGRHFNDLILAYLKSNSTSPS
jgi:serine/threonine protein kinase